MHTFTEDKVFFDLYNTVRSAYIKRQEYNYEYGYESEITFAECMYYWEEEELPMLMDKYAVRFFDGGGFANDYNNAMVRIDGYEFDLENIFNEVAKEFRG